MNAKEHDLKPISANDGEAPELGDRWFSEADLKVGDKLVRRGRPKSAAPKEAISIRLSREVLDYFRTGGAGWQTRIDEALREVIETQSKKGTRHAAPSSTRRRVP